MRNLPGAVGALYNDDARVKNALAASATTSSATELATTSAVSSAAASSATDLATAPAASLAVTSSAGGL